MVGDVKQCGVMMMLMMMMLMGNESDENGPERKCWNCMSTTDSHTERY